VVNFALIDAPAWFRTTWLVFATPFGFILSAISGTFRIYRTISTSFNFWLTQLLQCSIAYRNDGNAYSQGRLV